MEETRQLKRIRSAGVAAIVLGVGAALVGALFAHFTGLDTADGLGREIYPSIPRGWVYETIGQIVSLSGFLLILGGITAAWLYEREMTWARAAIGSLVFVSLMMILFGVIPNEWLNLTQAEWEWTPTKIALTIPPALILNNQIDISFAVIKDIVSGTYSAVALGGVVVAMYKWQMYQKNKETAAPPEPVSEYGRPVTKLSRGDMEMVES